jgi:hypothetical protein
MVGAAVLGCAVSSAGSAAVSPSNRLASIFAAAQAARSVHYTTSVTGPLDTGVDFVVDAGLSAGVQHITYRRGGQVGHVTVLVTPIAAYVRGDRFMLLSYLDFPAAAAAKYANRWIRVTNADPGYGSVVAGITLGSVIEELKLSGVLSAAPGTNLNGRQVVGVRASDSETGRPVVRTIYAPASGSPLPVEEVTTQGKSRFTVVLSKWNEAVRVDVPAGATPISVVAATH